MIKIERTDEYGWEAAARGMRNPLNSWEKSDSHYCYEPSYKSNGCWGNELNDLEDGCNFEHYYIGKNDLKLMKKLVASGTDHSKFMRMVNVTADITAPLYWWKEFDTYKVGTVGNSCSTMHKIHSRNLTIEDFSHEHLKPGSVELLLNLIDHINAQRRFYLNGAKGVPGDDWEIKPGDKSFWWQMIQLLPSSYNQKRTVQFNYAVLRNIYHSRKNHKLDEWHDFCRWVERLRYSSLITQ